MDFISLSVFALALLLNAGTPGPSIAALVSRVLARGAGDIYPFVAAMWVGEIIWLVAALFGLAQLTTTFHLAFVLLKYVGAAYLLFLAWKMWQQPDGEPEELAETQNPNGMFLSGLALTLGNPKIMVFYIALLPTFFDLSSFSVGNGALVCVVTLAVLATIDLFYITLAGRARQVFKSPKVAQTVNRVSATVMGGVAVAIATR